MFSVLIIISYFLHCRCDSERATERDLNKHNTIEPDAFITLAMTTQLGKLGKNELNCKGDK